METFSALLAICAGNSPVPGEFPTQRPVTRGFDVYFDLRPNKRLSKQLWGWWFETQSRPLWRHRNDICRKHKHYILPIYYYAICRLVPAITNSNYIHYNVWDDITYPFPNFNSGAVEVWKWISNYRACDYLSTLRLKSIHVSKRGYWCHLILVKSGQLFWTVEGLHETNLQTNSSDLPKQ